MSHLSRPSKLLHFGQAGRQEKLRHPQRVEPESDCERNSEHSLPPGIHFHFHLMTKMKDRSFSLVNEYPRLSLSVTVRTRLTLMVAKASRSLEICQAVSVTKNHNIPLTTNDWSSTSSPVPYLHCKKCSVKMTSMRGYSSFSEHTLQAGEYK